MCKITELLGKTLSRVEVLKKQLPGKWEKEEVNQIIFTCENGDRYRMFHEYDCCESVTIEDIVGDIDDLVGSPILVAEEVCSRDENMREYTYDQSSHTWTFYKFATINGYVIIRWYGVSNGYYSESVDFEKIEK